MVGSESEKTAKTEGRPWRWVITGAVIALIVALTTASINTPKISLFGLPCSCPQVCVQFYVCLLRKRRKGNWERILKSNYEYWSRITVTWILLIVLFEFGFWVVNKESSESFKYRMFNSILYVMGWKGAVICVVILVIMRASVCTVRVLWSVRLQFGCHVFVRCWNYRRLNIIWSYYPSYPSSSSFALFSFCAEVQWDGGGLLLWLWDSRPS